MLFCLRSISLIEAVSYLLLIGVAMPLKYLAGMPLMVQIMGMAHGALFVLLIVLLVLAGFVTTIATNGWRRKFISLSQDICYLAPNYLSIRQ